MQAIIECLVGALVVAAAVADIFTTILVPGPVIGRLRVVLRVRQISLPIWQYAAGRRAGKDGRPSNRFAPAALAITFAVWMLLLLTGFGLLMHGVRTSFSPELTRFDDALWVAGSSLLTLGVSEYDADGLARWLILGAGLAGFSALTASITFMLQIQAGLHQREPRVLTLVGMAGAPPSGIAILETVAKLSDRGYLERFFAEWRDWAAATLHSHLSYPVLSYYRSSDGESDWLTALEAVLDAATLVMALTQASATGAATLMHRTGARTASVLSGTFKLSPAPETPVEAEFAALAERLRLAGFDAAVDGPAIGRLIDLRADYAPNIGALATHLGARRAVLLPR